MQYLTRGDAIGKRRRNAIRGAAFLAGLAITAAVAFFLATLIGDGSHEGLTGEGPTENLPVSIDFPDGVSPDNPVEVSATITNETTVPIELMRFEMDVETPSVPVCGEEWLRIRPEVEGGGTSNNWEGKLAGENENPFGPYAPGEQDVFDGINPELEAVWLEFDPALTEGTDQSACEEVPVVVTAHAETPGN